MSSFEDIARNARQHAEDAKRARDAEADQLAQAEANRARKRLEKLKELVYPRLLEAESALKKDGINAFVKLDERPAEAATLRIGEKSSPGQRVLFSSLGPYIRVLSEDVGFKITVEGGGSHETTMRVHSRDIDTAIIAAFTQLVQRHHGTYRP